MSDFILPDIFRQWMISKNLGQESGAWPVFIGFLPNTPDQALAVYDTAGRPDGRIMKSGERIEHPGIQVRVRSRNIVIGSSKASLIAQAMDAARNETVVMDEETEYLLQNISRTGAPINLGPEEEAGSQRRFNYTINSIITYRKLKG